MKIRALIIDDEPLARELIATLLSKQPDVEILGQSANGQVALEHIRQFNPDLIFLDVQMPGLDGFGLLAELPQNQWPLIIFVTAYEKYAVRAFEARAVDYLLKPFEYERLGEAVERARVQLHNHGQSGQQARILALLEDLQKSPVAWDRLAIRDPGRILFIKPEEIDWIESEGNYLRLHIGARSHLLRETMADAETKLAPKNFLRISRFNLVNLERIREWQPKLNGDSLLILQDNTRLAVSRNYREALDNLVARF